MNYFPFYHNEYRASTAHLTNDEDLAYMRLLILYYDTEQPIKNDLKTLSRRLRIDAQVIESVLSDFFYLTEEGWRNNRADIEISKYHAKADIAKTNGKLGGRPAKNQKPNHNPEETGSEPRKTQSVFLANPEKPSGNRIATGSKANKNQNQNQNKEPELEYISYPTDTRSFFNEQEAPGGEIVESAPVSKALIESPKSESKAVKRAKFEREQAELFEKWWKAYPRKQAKKTAFNAWLKIQPSPTMDDVSKLVQIVSVQARTAQWTKDNGEFIPMPATYINQARWTDQVTEISNEPNYGSADW